MKNNQLKQMYRVIFVVLAFLVSLPAAYGFSRYPLPHENYINDFANVIQPNDAQELREKLKSLEKQTGIEGTVVTINSIIQYETGDTTIEGFAKGIFNQWGVGNKDNNGFLLLVSVQDRKCRIELGSSYGSQYNARMKEIIEKVMIPFFKSGDYSTAIYGGTTAVMESVTTKVSWFRYYRWHLLGGVVLIFCFIAAVNSLRKGKSSWVYIVLAALASFFLAILLSPFSGRRYGNNNNYDDNSYDYGSNDSDSDSFGGGSSSGDGGASGEW
jgi:uncharacterized membrane protein YgcG